MANNVQLITEGILSQMATTLDSSWQALDYFYRPDKNHKRTKKKGYGCYPSGASSEDGLNRFYTMNMGFNLMLMNEYGHRTASTNNMAVTYLLHDKMDEIIKQLYLTKISLSATVIIVDGVSFDEPEILDQEHSIILNAAINVKYRNQIA